MKGRDSGLLLGSQANQEGRDCCLDFLLPGGYCWEYDVDLPPICSLKRNFSAYKAMRFCQGKNKLQMKGLILPVGNKGKAFPPFPFHRVFTLESCVSTFSSLWHVPLGRLDRPLVSFMTQEYLSQEPAKHLFDMQTSRETVSLFPIGGEGAQFQWMPCSNL